MAFQVDSFTGVGGRNGLHAAVKLLKHLDSIVADPTPPTLSAAENAIPLDGFLLAAF